MRLRFAALIAVLSLAVSALPTASIGSPPPDVSFSYLPPGWHAYPGSNGAYALSWRYRPNSSGWASSMPKNGIAVNVFFPLQTAHYPSLKRVLPKVPATTLEGAPDTPEYRIHGRVRGRDVEVWVDIRRVRPTKAQLRFAQRVVSAIHFASPAG